MSGQEIQWDDLLYHDGAFPRQEEGGVAVESLSGDLKWNIGFGASPTGRPDMNMENPDLNSQGVTALSGGDPQLQKPCTGDCLMLFSKPSVKAFNIVFDENNNEVAQIWGMYRQIYDLLGSVESAQFSVLKRLAAEHNFLQKSYYLNVGDQAGQAQSLHEGQQAATQFGGEGADALVNQIGSGAFKCLKKARLLGRKLGRGGMGVQELESATDVNLTDDQTAAECGGGLFQVVSIPMRGGVDWPSDSGGGDGAGWSRGWPVTAQWQAPTNSFGVDLNTLMINRENGPKVHASVSLWRGTSGGEPLAAVWPKPNPKFQVRTHP
jgi:hypothetical protein